MYLDSKSALERNLNMKKIVLKTIMVMLYLVANNFQLAKAEENNSLLGSGTCGENCTWSLDTKGNMIISGSGSMIGFVNRPINGVSHYVTSQDEPRPWEGYIQKIVSIRVEGSITNIGKRAFAEARNLKEVYMPNVSSIGDYSFNGAVSLYSVDLPNVTRIGEGAFQATRSLIYAGIRDDVVLSTTSVPSFPNGCSPQNRNACGTCGNDYIMSGLGCVKDCGSGYLGKEGRCIDASLGCGAGYRQFENFCNRIRYTPAEAAPLLNDNNNTVTITFKK